MPIVAIDLSPCVNHLRAGGVNVLIDYFRLPVARIPLEKPISALATRPSDASPLLPGARDPFLYNPRKLIGQVSILYIFLFRS